MSCIVVRRIAVRIAIPQIALLAISCGYQPGSFSARGQPFGSSLTTDRTTIGCLDIGIERINVTELEDTSPTGPTVSFTMANRCDHPAVVDFTRIVVTTINGQQLMAFDPRREIHQAVLGARKIAVETIEFHPSPTSPESSLNSSTAICVDISAITDATISGTAASGSVIAPVLCPPPPRLARYDVTLKEGN